MKLSTEQRIKVKEILLDYTGLTVGELPITNTEEEEDVLNLRNDFGMDSLDIVEVIMKLEKEFACVIEDGDADVDTLGHLYSAVAKSL